MGITKQEWVLRAGCLVFVYLILAAGSQAQDIDVEEIPRSNPEEMVEQAARKVLELSKEAKSYAKKDPERLYENAAAILEHVVDADYFSRAVMGTYASIRRYRALETDAEKAAFRERVERFQQKMKGTFINSYARALTSLNARKVSLSHSTREGRGGTVTVQQTIRGVGRGPYNVDYRLHQDNEGNWLIFNVLVEGVNVGQVFRNQFAALVERHGGDVDYVINNWDRLMDRTNPLPEPDEQES